jgi:hypothetical protein
LSRVERRFDDSREDVGQSPGSDIEDPKTLQAPSAAIPTPEAGGPTDEPQSEGGESQPVTTADAITTLHVTREPGESPETEDD